MSLHRNKETLKQPVVTNEITKSFNNMITIIIKTELRQFTILNCIFDFL